MAKQSYLRNSENTRLSQIAFTSFVLINKTTATATAKTTTTTAMTASTLESYLLLFFSFPFWIFFFSNFFFFRRISVRFSIFCFNFEKFGRKFFHRQLEKRILNLLILFCFNNCQKFVPEQSTADSVIFIKNSLDKLKTWLIIDFLTKKKRQNHVNENISFSFEVSFVEPKPTNIKIYLT